ncbi:MAG: terminase [Stappia sp.]|uniref:phage terminase large subunit family protein n=1 Tax=Stappia sp. TaxID=1870903 RepID=UPI000C676029|nr:terminase gpA endonuclease subunit [Stappia sp.]MAA99707.1 terminase [Stappia sp.]MBM21259.1 terminase [Stappia sp.]
MTHMIVETANAEHVALQAFIEVMTPPPPVDYLAWAGDNIVFSARESSFPGPYNRELFPYFDEILTALSPEDPCRTVTLQGSAQIGKTVVANIFTLGSIAMDPGDFLVVHPTEPNAKRWSKMKLSPMLKNTASLRHLFPMSSRDGSDSVLYKERRDGRGAIQISGANSPASLSQVSMRRQFQDDLSKWEMNAAGDPEGQADSRSNGFEFAKILKLSTPLIMPGCRITRSYEAGSQEKPHVPCPHCGHMQVLTWSNMLEYLDEDAPENAHFVCEDPDCGGIIEEHHRKAMLARLEWRADNPKARRHHRSFWIWAAYSVLTTWERIARAWLAAKGEPAAEQVFFNDQAGEAYVTEGDAPDWEGLRDRAEATGHAPGVIPAGALVTTLGIDCQDDRVEAQLVGWGRNRQRFVIQYFVIPGHIREDATRARLDALLKQTWPNAFGQRLPVDMVAIDGNAYTPEVWEWVRRHPASRVIMVRGARSETSPLLQRVKKETDEKTGKLKRYSRRFYNFNGAVLKMALYANLRKEDPLEAGYVGLPRGLEDEYFRQLTAERRVEKVQKSGFKVYVWEKDKGQANEGLDTMNQAEAAAMRFGVRSLTDAMWDKLEAEREVAPPERQLDLEELPLVPVQEGEGPVRSEGEAPVTAASRRGPSNGKSGGPSNGKSHGKSLGSLARNLNG